MEYYVVVPTMLVRCNFVYPGEKYINDGYARVWYRLDCISDMQLPYLYSIDYLILY